MPTRITDVTAAGVVLAGGRSSRMGEPKAALEWHGSTLLYRAAAILARTVAGPVVVVAAPGQAVPELPGGVAVVEDPVEGRGPVQGLAVGLAAVADRADAAFVCSTDLPFLHPAFVRRVLRELDASVDVVLPVAHGYRQPLAAAYRTGLAGLAARLAAGGDARPGMVFERCAVTRLADADLLADPALARLDPDLDSVLNVNTPEDYRAARDREPPEIGVGGAGTVPAATLGAAADHAGVALGRGVVELNGDEVTPDARMPLVAGDTVTFG
ncbi:molybdenum cofactor guanylyltransferase [Actinophytocola gossypii]|uniref:Probable molybdenum cofactor guanylyltransferase n=1 Tax=Actinophytocola gossypii TaxID=2812003 RepID=A0ABT2J2A6_9PSEU|nr:molybdenum cofactor guanylyltransferase [Actinophytocola gossypii]MCT2581943.1 molybdenum cofactor guanylyltransferase [Actinophytocola gossypii]